MSDFITLSCPNCAGRLRVVPESASLVCPSCGNEYLVRHDAGGVLLESYARCPRCGRNDQVRIVSAIVREQTALAAALGAPTEPVPEAPLAPRKASRALVRRAVLSAIGALLSFVLGAGGEDFFILTWLVCMVLAVIWGIKARKVHAEARDREVEALASQAAGRAVWERAMARWQELYYCARDDRVFIPGEHQAVPVAQMHDLLYR